MALILERIKYEYHMTKHQIQVMIMKRSNKSRDFKSAYYQAHNAVNSGLKAAVVCRKMGEETMYLREALRNLKAVEKGFLRLLDKRDLSEVVREHPYIKHVREKFGSAK